MKRLIILGIFLCCLLGAVTGQARDVNRPPTIAEGLNSFDVVENTTVGTVVYTVLGFDPENERVMFDMTGDLFAIGRDSGRITVNRPLDFEQYRFVNVNISGTDGFNTAWRRVRINIIDSNDEIPEFGRELYQLRIPENARIGTPVIRNITVTDPDTVNSDITVICRRQARANQIDPCDYFRVQTESFSRNAWRGHLVLIKQLDFENTPSFRVPLQASDGRNRRDTEVQVTVEDIQDKPPVFVGPTSATVREGIRVGTLVLTFSATDGDQTNGLGVEYELISNPGGYFRLDRTTGRLTTVRELDREALINGLITIQVAAQEKGEGGDFRTRTVTQGTITVADANDNGPRFDVISPAIVTIKEDVADQTPLDSTLTVSDKDEGVNAQFVLRLLTYNDTFEVYPSVGRGSLTANIRVRDTSKIDYETGPKEYLLRLEAREGLTSERRSSVAFVTVKLEDVNDNKPQFGRTSYEASVSELATTGTVVTRITATDADSGIYGVQGLRYKLIGNGADRFVVNRLTGEITVRRCATPGSGNCLDAETKPFYDLIFLARDNFAEGFVEQVPLRINVLDENDNSPIFTLGDYESYIDEGDVRPDPPVTVLATDADSNRNGNNVITYSIIGGNPSGVWQIGLTSGVVTATRPVDFASTPGGSGTYTLTVQAADPRYKTTGTVRIHVRDKNDFTPTFVPSAYYEESILENSPEGMSVMTVQAYDNDASTSPNGQVLYRISSGSQDKFIINRNTGVITVNRGATFDFDQQKRYEMRVIAADQGTPSRSATATAVVLIRDANNKKPYFEPSSVRVDIYENATVNTRVTQMKAKDPDSNAVLIYSFVQPYRAWDPNGRPVDQSVYDFTDLFTIDPNSGIVRTKRLLDRDKAAVVSTTVRVRDTTGSPDQTALATLIINILEVNDRAPQFPFPWTPTNRFLNISVREELPPSFTVTTIQATDPHDAVVDYRIIENPGDFFNINPITGVVTIKRTIDYEKTQKTYFVVTAADNGRPPLTSTATVNVNVININDNTPTFTEIEYSIDLEENARPGTVVAVLRATDLDLGDYGEVRYSLKDPLNRFVVDPITGVVTVREGAVLDRETTTVITLTAEAYDSPQHPNDRKTSNIPIYITLIDTNDHTPTFEQTVYETSISEKVPVQFSVVQVSATDGDSGPNAQLEYFFINGNPQRLFVISPTTGLITTGQPLEGRAGQYNLTVGVRDSGTPRLVGRALVIVNVIEANNEPPTWIWPVFDNQTIGVLENQYLGMVITNLVKAKDDGEGDNGLITYGFYYNNQFVAETPNFRINPITGIITARAVYDRETRDEYVVKLVARDGGNPPFESTRYVIIKILDTDDHNPVYPTYQNCCVVPVRFSVQENMPRMQLVGQVNATDLDIGQNAETRYSIINGNTGKAFYVNATSGAIYTNRSLDHEVKSVYTLAIRARNVQNPNRVYPNPLCACTDQSVILVTVDVRNRNDFPPVFSSSLFNACVSVDAQIGKSITTIRALDPDSPTPDAVRYNLSSIRGYRPKDNNEYLGDKPGLFFIGRTNGSIHSNMLMTMYKDDYFSMKVIARDVGNFSSNATLRIFVTDPAQEVLITVKEPPNQVMQGRLEDIVKWVSEATGGGIVCVNDVRFHVDGSDTVIVTWTDILLHVVDGSTLTVWDSDSLTEKLWPSTSATAPLAQSLLITKIEPANAFWGGFYIDPVLAAVLLTLLLLLLLLLLLCCICCCCKGKRRIQKSGLMIQPSGQINPLWKDKLYEDQELNMKLDTVTAGADNAGFVLGEDATARLALGEGQQVTQTTRTETSHEYAMNYERTTMGGQAHDAVDAGGLRIEAPLEGGQRHQAAVLLNGSHFGGGGSLMADSATQVELMASRASLRDEASNGPSAIGARLHSYALDGTQEVHSNDFAYHVGNTSMNRMREEEYISSWPGAHTAGHTGTLHTTGTMNGNVVHDIHVEDSDRSFHVADSPDGLYQGEIILGSYHLPQFPNQQRQETRYRTESQQYLYEDNYH